MSIETVLYRLDAQDCIVEVGGAWDQFAIENGGDLLIGDSVIGQPLYRYVQGDTTRIFVRSVIEGVRVLKQARTLPYRCDSAQERRYLEMSVIPEDSGHVTLEHRLLRMERFPAAQALNFAPASGAKLHVRCSMCNRIRHADEWREPDRIPVDTQRPLQIIHGVCPDCMRALHERRCRIGRPA
ncbi:MAG: hypothetical protein LCH90_13140 [Proteobacteria bacterium]|nr:hypothetical protein [Pseudomonadota bacterium]